MAAAEQDIKKRLALAIADFLSTSLKDGTVDAGDKDSIEIAQQCISDVFHIDPSDKTAMNSAIGNQNLLQIYTVYDKLKGSSAPGAKAASSGASASSTTGGASSNAGANASGTSAESENFKSAGNEAMKSKNYTTAIESYSKALNLFPLNPIYLSNRAAAHSGAGQHAQASTDAEIAVANDPTFTKAWSRLGYARLALGDSKGSVEAYEKGIEYEGNGGSEIMKKALAAAKQKLAADEAEEKDADEEDAVEGSARGAGQQAGGMPDLSALAGMFGGGGGGGGGGMPDLSSIMSNPMFANMAKKMMSDPQALQGLMNNPQLKEMANKFGGGGGGGAGTGAGGAGGSGGGGQGGGMPDLASMMNDPSIAEMAKKFMGGQGGGGGAQ